MAGQAIYRTIIRATIRAGAFLIIGVTARAALAQGDSCLINRIWSVPLRIENNEIILSVKLNQTSVEAIFDTGAYTSFAPKAIFGKFNLVSMKKSVDALPPEGPPVRVELFSGTIDLGGKPLVDRPFAESELVAQRSDRILMAASAVSDYGFYVNTSGSVFKIIDQSVCGDDYVPFNGRYQKLPALLSRGEQGDFVPVEINGTPFSALFDTGTNLSVINRETAHALGISDDDLAKDQKIVMHLISGTADGRVHDVRSIKLGDYIYYNRKVIVENARFDVIIGEDILKSLNMYFAANRSGIYIQAR